MAAAEEGSQTTPCPRCGIEREEYVSDLPCFLCIRLERIKERKDREDVARALRRWD